MYIYDKIDSQGVGLAGRLREILSYNNKQ